MSVTSGRDRRSADEFLEAPQPAVCRDPDGAGRFPRMTPDCGGVEPCNDPEHDHFGLVSRQRGDQRQGRIGAQVVDGQLGGVVLRGQPLERGVVGRRARSAMIVANRVEDLVAGDGENPGPKAGSPPSNFERFRITWTQVSDARS